MFSKLCYAIQFLKKELIHVHVILLFVCVFKITVIEQTVGQNHWGCVLWHLIEG